MQLVVERDWPRDTLAPSCALVPEGDTIFRAAGRLHAALVGRALVRFGGPPLTASRVGRVVVDVRSRGKNLIVAFDDGLLLCTHLLMNGSLVVLEGARREEKGRG